MPRNANGGPQDPTAAQRLRPWAQPKVTDLPRLVRLTLQTGDSIPGGGGTGGGGSTVVP
jgi:hypothetical protein